MRAVEGKPAPNPGRHSTLYSFLALSLVRNEPNDAATVAVYLLPHQSEVYWSKNRITTDDIMHAENTAALVREFASFPCMEYTAFINSYFDTLFANCLPEIMRRIAEIRTAFDTLPFLPDTKPSTDDFYSWQGVQQYLEV
jgi:hypothetical protein